MTKISIAFVSTAALTIATALSSIAHAEPKAQKPVTCTTWSLATAKDKETGKDHQIAICTDRKTPVVLQTYVAVKLPDGNGDFNVVLVGYRTR